MYGIQIKLTFKLAYMQKKRVLARRGPNAVYSTIDYEINVVGGVIPKFYIFKGERL